LTKQKKYDKLFSLGYRKSRELSDLVTSDLSSQELTKQHIIEFFSILLNSDIPCIQNYDYICDGWIYAGFINFVGQFKIYYSNENYREAADCLEQIQIFIGNLFYYSCKQTLLEMGKLVLKDDFPKES
jgi:hypothetical protein